MTWEQALVAVWMLVMFAMHGLGSYIQHKTDGSRWGFVSWGAVFIGVTFLVVVAALHHARFW